MGILKTALGLVAAAATVGAVKVVKESEDPGLTATAVVVGAVTSATAYHLLKEEIKGGKK